MSGVAPYYKYFSDQSIAWARAEIDACCCTLELVEVPGALEIPGAIVQAEIADAGYDGYVALGCVIRGETTHYDYVCGESARGLMELNLNGVIAGNGILTVENRDQAMVRAVDKKKGADATNAALSLIALRDKFGAA
ncbi:MAG: 6,7-dimethyl-8-ribityllumazine synthase [Alphaproteobacteria bacterium]|nr:6,7-dimethyl-8-ribityllumazine synthase [Alphaproteobacteria bacterium]